MSEAFPSTNGIAAPRPCSADTLFSGKNPTIMTPTPDMAIAAKPAFEARPFAKLRETSTDPSVMVMPSTTNDVFIKLWSGEQTYRPFQVPQAVFPRSLIVSRDRL